jgi:hypothetical protein
MGSPSGKMHGSGKRTHDGGERTLDGGGTRTHVEDGVGQERGWGARFAVRLLPVALILLSAAISHRVTNGPTQAAGRGNSPSVLGAISRRPALSFGFPNFLGDLVWLEAVQVSGNRKMLRDDYDRLSDLLSTVIRFDPRFVVPYLLGGIVLGDSPDHAGAALDLLSRGEGQVPLEWRLPFYTGYVQYFSLGNSEEGGMALLRAARIPGSPDYFPLLASRMLSEGHRPDTALAFLQKMVEREADPRRKASLEERIRRVEVERDLQSFDRAIVEYMEHTGVRPRELGDLVRAGVLVRIPEEPYGGQYFLMPDGEVWSDRAPRERLKVLRKR